MKKISIAVCFVAVFLFVLPITATHAAEACFDPVTQFWDMNGESKLSFWGVPEANGNGITADAQNSWHSELSVATWYATTLKAQEMGMQIVLGFDPNTFELWYVARPRNAPCQ